MARKDDSADAGPAPEPQPKNLPSAAPDSGVAQAQARSDIDTDKGFHGLVPDPTPNEHYTVQGVVAGLPTPETDPALAAQAAAKSEEVAARLGALGPEGE